MNVDLEDIQLENVREHEHEHDQLPSVEEVHATHVVRSSGAWRPKKKQCLIAAVVFFVFIIVIITGVSVKGKQSEMERQQDILKFVAPYTDSATLADTNSPQFQAAHWLAFDDDKQNLPLDGKRFLQRYALMVLYFATSGGEWLEDVHFATTDRDECFWHQGFSQTSGDTVPLGVTCDEDEQVTAVVIDSMGMVGTLPSELSLLTHLQLLSLENNSLSGALPAFLHEFKELTSLQLNNNGFKYQLPKWLGLMTQLRNLELRKNNFDSTIPIELRQMTSLRTIAIQDNALVGDLSVLSTMTWLEEAYLQDNHFDETIGNDFFANLQKLNVLNLSGNLLKGKLPNHLLQTLQVLDVHNNLLHGSFNSIPKSTSLQVLHLSKNKLTGAIPTTIANLVNLQRLDLSDNLFDGNIPATLSALKKMTYLNLAENSFSPEGIPTFLRSMPLLSELSLKATGRTGKIPQWVGSDLKNLILLDLDNNALSGKIPSNLSNLQKMEYFLLSRNELTGELPVEIGGLSKLSVFLMENNTITGSAGDLCKLRMSTFASDCTAIDGATPEFDCPCCTRCCPSSLCDATWVTNVAITVMQDEYERRSYSAVPVVGGK